MTADQLKDLSKRIIGIREFLKIDKKKLQLKEHELKTHDPEFWNDPKSAEAHMKLIRELKFWVSGFDDVEKKFGDLEVLVDFVKEEMASEEELGSAYSNLLDQIEDLELRNMLSKDEDKLNAVIQVTAGAGGTESCDWTSMLMRMYIMWAESNGYKVKELNYHQFMFILLLRIPLRWKSTLRIYLGKPSVLVVQVDKMSTRLKLRFAFVTRLREL